MASVEIPDFSFIDVDELGMRPHDWVEDGNGMEFDGTGQDYFGVDKSLHFDPYTSLKSGKKFLIDETNTNMSDDDDFLNDSQYEIDPETGKQKLLDGRMTGLVCWHNRRRDRHSIFTDSI